VLFVLILQHLANVVIYNQFTHTSVYFRKLFSIFLILRRDWK